MDCRDHVTPVTAINGCRRHPAHVADDIAPPTQERQDETFYERRLCEPRAFHRRARDRRRGRRPAWPGADHSAPAAALRLAASSPVADLVRGPGPLLQALLRDEWTASPRKTPGPRDPGVLFKAAAALRNPRTVLPGRQAPGSFPSARSCRPGA